MKCIKSEKILRVIASSSLRRRVICMRDTHMIQKIKACDTITQYY